MNFQYQSFFSLIRNYEIYDKDHGFIIQKEELLEDLYYLIDSTLSHTFSQIELANWKVFFNSHENTTIKMLNYFCIEKLVFLIHENYDIKDKQFDMSSLSQALQ
jgi:hypothetical protein